VTDVVIDTELVVRHSTAPPVRTHAAPYTG
jgi:hypothetical protein